MPQHPLSAMMKLDPGLVQRVDGAQGFVYADGALPRKVKLLMALAFDAGHGAAAGVRSLAQSAMKAGATKEEIAESIRVAYELAGVGAVFAASAGLEGLFD